MEKTKIFIKTISIIEIQKKILQTFEKLLSICHKNHYYLIIIIINTIYNLYII
jgi:hypothetical protein